MDLISINFFSHELGSAVRVNVLLPVQTQEEILTGARHKPYQALTLLHGMEGDDMSWLRLTRAECYASERGLALIMPAFANSYAMDLAYNMHYEQFLSKELPSYLRTILPLSDKKEDNFIAGLSMGGYAALRLALLHSDSYAYCASLSGALSPSKVAKRLGGAAGQGIAELPRLSGSDISDIIASADITKCPRAYIACGLEDTNMLDINRAVYSDLKAAGGTVEYEEWHGEHDWTFWDEGVRRIITRLPL